MKTKLFMSLMVFGLMLFCNSCKGEHQNASEKDIVNMLYGFYERYITETAKIPLNIHNVSALKDKHCTSRLIRKIKDEELDYDPFLKSQDCDIEWLESLEIKKDESKDDLYHVSYKDAYSGDKVVIGLVVVKEKDTYKIDDVY